MLDALAGGQALFFRGAVRPGRRHRRHRAGRRVWDLVWAGQLTNDTLAPLRALLGGGGTHRRAGRAARAAAAPGTARPARPPGAAHPHGPPTVAGRWSRLPERDTDPTRAAARAAPRCCSSGTAWSPAAR